MVALLNWLRGIRVSNLMFLFILPVIIWLIATSRSYGPALKAVLGVEDNAWTLLAMYLLFSLLFAFGFWGALSLLRSLRPDESAALVARNRRRAALSFGLQALLAGMLSQSRMIDPYLVSVLVNEFDPRSVDFILMADNSFVLEAAFQEQFLSAAHRWLSFFAIGCGAIFFWALAPFAVHATRLGRLSWLAVLLANFAAAFYVIMISHAGFAVGIMVTLRAAAFAYLGASILGLVWALLGRLKPSHVASFGFAGLGLVLILVSAWHFTRPHDAVVLRGSLEGRIGIVAGTPQGLADTIRYGEFLTEQPDVPYKIRSLASVEQALELLEQGHVTAALIPVDAASDLPELWRADYLPVTTKSIAIVCLAVGALLILLVGIGFLVGVHPLAVFADFFVDTIRGVPMLVIILYVGLPLAGALKSASAGYIDLQMMTRGVVAIAIGYSAYMAEIFRAGIEAIPKGQIEAARTLGLREFQVARLIIVPQAIAIVLPALGNEFIAMLKDTSLVSILSVRDLTQRMREFQAQSFLAFEPFNSAALIYVLLTLVAASGIKALDKVVNKGRGH
ncbi:MAG TPA: amino acid ABC transporter permease [Rhodobacteraceae bacterium]|nr:amino acid ABC transporter permease [Paracoccaceae bacterium]